jgi:hypothetical protein
VAYTPYLFIARAQRQHFATLIWFAPLSPKTSICTTSGRLSAARGTVHSHSSFPLQWGLKLTVY